ncbi:S49 family peptidase [Candidatus Halobonum tyrrellensis]|uniref:Signal peptide peptidase SppA, 36K type n=1 Tax=Candidatus Halobonum tyrrellensis G22 TaxID=1324957 RepID=V4J0K0_9EURY|nr:S49 family peptidase [Candidatus Halobonum tyrrellensis]ESP88992.1 signal peptide peptidase SppA, 36K type [Candidatus Halobonum tyrrellensis G22]
MTDSSESGAPTPVRVVALLLAVVVAGAVGVAAFVVLPVGLADLLGVLLTIALVVVVARLVGRALAERYADYTVAEVEVSGPITRDGGGSSLPRSPTTPGADEVVDQIERADDDPKVEALMLKLNTPGGEVVPSDDIRLAAAEFDGPTVAYTTDLCASGGMWIASGCDELWARDASLVGSIGVRFSQTRFDEFADRYGVSYERIVSGAYKDATGAPFKRMEAHEREYLQGLSDAWYDNFVERVAESFEIDEQTVRQTEARVFLGEDAVEFGLVTALGTDDDAEARVGERIEGEPVRRAFEPERGLSDRFGMGVSRVAYALGAGVAAAFGADEGGLEL